MTCRHCGTEIAANALICYRCGTATADPKVPQPPSTRTTPVRWALLIAGGVLVTVAVVVFFAAVTLGWF